MSCYRNHRFYETSHGKELARSHSDQQNVDGEDLRPEGSRVPQGVPENDAKTKVASEAVEKTLAIAEKDPLPPLKMAVTKTASRSRPAARAKDAVKKFTVTTVDEFSGVYCDMLQDLFESTTGLYIRF